MQGHTQSSASIWTAFDNMTTAYMRFIKWLLKISWKRAVVSSAFATVGTSVIGGVDLVKGVESIFTGTDVYQYFDETVRLVSFEYDRTLQEPYGGMAICLANMVLDNTDGRFSPNNSQTIGTAILPNRPIQMALGFYVQGIDQMIYVFKGLTKQPQEDYVRGTVKIACIDYIQYLNEYPLESSIYTNQRSDQIIQDILVNQLGFGTSQYSLDEGLNTIGFAWFSKGTMAGAAIKKICEAEEAVFYQDEVGILRFENRRKFSLSPFNKDVWDIDPDDIVLWEGQQNTKIINRCTVKAKPRTVQASTEIWRNGIEESLVIGQSKEIWAQFLDPVTAITNPVATTDYLAYTGAGGTGLDVTANVTVTTTLFTTSVKITITNNYAGTVYIPFIRIRGTSAIVTGEVSEVFQDDSSVSKYNRNQIEIQNDFIDDPDFAYYLARAIVMKYKDPFKKIRLTVQGIPQLQLRDKVRVKDMKLGTYTNFRVMRVQGNLSGGLLTQILTLREVTSFEADSWAIVGQSSIEGADFVGS